MSCRQPLPTPQTPSLLMTKNLTLLGSFSFNSPKRPWKYSVVKASLKGEIPGLPTQGWSGTSESWNNSIAAPQPCTVTVR